MWQSMNLGVRAAKEIGIKEITIFGDVELISQQVINAYCANNTRLRNYRNEA
jgi:ribonuclease HI